MSQQRPKDPQQILPTLPFAVKLGIYLEVVEADRTTGRLAWQPDLCTAGGIMHGGAIMSLADTVAAVCAFLNLPEGARTATIDSTTRLFRPLSEGTLHAESRPVQVGRSVIVVNTDLTDDQGRRVAQTSQAQAVIT